MNAPKPPFVKKGFSQAEQMAKAKALREVKPAPRAPTVDTGVGSGPRAIPKGMR